MIDITDKSYQPNLAQISELIDNPLFDALCAHVMAAYRASFDIMFSGDNVLLGWNVRFHKSGRTLLRLYPKRGRFTVLVVVGRKEKARVEALLPAFSEEMRTLYQSTQEGMGQRWLLLELSEPGAVYQDILQLVDIRSGSRQA